MRLNKTIFIVVVLCGLIAIGGYSFLPKKVAAGPRINGAVYIEHTCTGASMEPVIPDNSIATVATGDEVVGSLARGDIVLFKYPGNPKFQFVKRIIALPSEEIKIKNNEVRVNNILLNERYLNRESTTNGEINITLKNNEYFLMGDNRQNSSDSRAFGPVTKDLIVGQIWSVRRVLIR